MIKPVNIILFAVMLLVFAALGVAQFGHCLTEHSFLNCSATRGWGYMTVLD